VIDKQQQGGIKRRVTKTKTSVMKKLREQLMNKARLTNDERIGTNKFPRTKEDW